MNNSLVKSLFLSRSNTDISKLVIKYKINDYIVDSPYLPFIENYSILVNNSNTVPMSQRYEFRPDYVSYDYYKTTNLWILILLVNKVTSILDFNKENLEYIIVPEQEVVNSIISKIRNKNVIKDVYHEQ